MFTHIHLPFDEKIIVQHLLPPFPRQKSAIPPLLMKCNWRTIVSRAHLIGLVDISAGSDQHSQRVAILCRHDDRGGWGGGGGRRRGGFIFLLHFSSLFCHYIFHHFIYRFFSFPSTQFKNIYHISPYVTPPPLWYYQNRYVNITHESALGRKLALIIKISILNQSPINSLHDLSLLLKQPWPNPGPIAPNCCRLRNKEI